MKKVLTLLWVAGLIFSIISCSKDTVDSDNPDTGSLSLTIEGVTYNFAVDYKATGQQNATAVFATNSSDNTTTLSASNITEGTSFTIKVNNKAIQTIGDYPVSPTDDAGVVTFSTKTKNYKQSYQQGCDNTLLYTTVTLGVSRLSKNNLIAEGSFKGKMAIADGEMDCTNLKVTKWKQVDITGNFQVAWQTVQ